jgi:hypothetical protein
MIKRPVLVRGKQNQLFPDADVTLGLFMRRFADTSNNGCKELLFEQESTFIIDTEVEENRKQVDFSFPVETLTGYLYHEGFPF